MINEFAITPDVFECASCSLAGKIDDFLFDKFERFLNEININGELADFNNGEFIKYVFQKYLNILPPYEKDLVLNRFKYFFDHNRIINRPSITTGPLDTQEDWIRVILESHAFSPLDRILSTNKYKENHDIRIPDEVLIRFPQKENDPNWALIKGKYRIRVRPETNGIVPFLEKFLKYATELEIIDPYINCFYPPSKNVLELCGEHIGKGFLNTRAREISIHTSTKSIDEKYKNVAVVYNTWVEFQHALEAYLNICENHLQDLSDKFGVCYKLYIWCEYREPEERFHKRRLFTNQFGIQSDNSFRFYDYTKSRDSWVLLPVEDLEDERLSLIQPQKNPYYRFILKTPLVINPNI